MAKRPYLVQASYVTPTGRMGGTTYRTWAVDMTNAVESARAFLTRTGRTKLDIRVTPVDEPAWP